jgi:hypothetical protein
MRKRNESFFYREKQGIKGPPLSPAPQIPAELPPLRSGTSRLTDSEHLLHNHHASVASLRLLFTFAPECRSASLRNRCSPSPEYPEFVRWENFTLYGYRSWVRRSWKTDPWGSMNCWRSISVVRLVTAKKCSKEQTKMMIPQNSSSRCKALTTQGKPCRAAATEGGLCFFHANPNKAVELGRIGGKQEEWYSPGRIEPPPQPRYRNRHPRHRGPVDL